MRLCRHCGQMYWPDRASDHDGGCAIKREPELLVMPMAEEAVVAAKADRTRTKSGRSREAHNAYQRDYMRKRRAALAKHG